MATTLKTNPHFLAVFNLSEAEIDALLPRAIFHLLVKVAIRTGDDKTLHALARDWAPYEHARRVETVLTSEELHRVVFAAKAEAGRRGLVIDVDDSRNSNAM